MRWARSCAKKFGLKSLPKSGNSEIVQFRNPNAALGNGRVQRTAQRAFMISDLVSTGEVVQRAHRIAF